MKKFLVSLLFSIVIVLMMVAVALIDNIANARIAMESTLLSMSSLICTFGLIAVCTVLMYLIEEGK